MSNNRSQHMSLEQAEKVFSRFGVYGPLQKYSAEQLKTLYLALAKKNHPDVGGSVECMTEINGAYEVLKKVNVGLEAFGFNKNHPPEETKHRDAVNQFWQAARDRSKKL